ncbi:MAG TPA: LacI family DNA-binding transcriptional regulator [Actinopolymorphaceae bacterium]
MPVTLADVADACGLSASTVSRALSDPDKVHPRTRDRIRAVAERLGYVPNHLARSLASGRTGILGLIVPDIANPFFPPLVKAVQARAGGHGCQVLLADTDEYAGDEIGRARSMGRRIDGLILASPRSPDADLRRLRDATAVPVVMVNRDVEDFPCVLVDEAEGMTQAVRHLTALGHTHLGYLAGPRRSWSNTQRSAAVAAACERYGAKLVEFGPFEPQIQAGVQAADLVLASTATAVIAYDDLIALGAMARFAERGVRVGSDVSVVGVDDSPMSELAHPTLTSIQVPSRDLGSAAIDLLLEQLGGAEQRRLTLETRLVVRASTGPVP